MELIAIIAIAAASFAATSFDNLLILVGLLGSSYRERAVAEGYLAAMLLVAAMAAALSVATHQLPSAYLGYLGLIPIGLGLWHLLRLRRSSPVPDGFRQTEGALPVALVTIAASGDSLATYVALLSDSAVALTVPILVTIAVCSAGWLAFARFLSSHERIVRLLRRSGRYLMPALLILIGVYILLDSPTDVVG